MPLILTEAKEAALLTQIQDLESLHAKGDQTYTDTFTLEELRCLYKGAWRVIEGGQEPKLKSGAV